jgi:hypothetical protein
MRGNWLFYPLHSQDDVKSHCHLLLNPGQALDVRHLPHSTVALEVDPILPQFIEAQRTGVSHLDIMQLTSGRAWI